MKNESRISDIRFSRLLFGRDIEMTCRADYDSPWKDILTVYFEQFLVFFFPKIMQEIDWSRGYYSLDKELRQITRKAEIGKRVADKLFQVWKKNGEERWVLVHVEIQAQEQADFSRRIFVYNYRIYDLYKRPVASLAVLADDNPKWRPSSYSHGLWGCSTEFRFPAVKILSYKKSLKSLVKSGNVFGIAVAAHLRTMETKKDSRKRFRYKTGLTKELYRQGFGKSDIINLYRFIDWMMALPEYLEDAYHQEIIAFEEEQNMRYVTTAERIGLKKGIREGIQQGIQQGMLLGRLIENILNLQRKFGRTVYSEKELEGKNLAELKNILSDMEGKSRESDC